MATTRRGLLAAAGLAPLPLLPPPALAQAWPARSITWIVPFTPGGITDTSSRLVAQPLGQRLGQQVIIDNKPGAGGSIGTEAVARAAPDGYTILYGTQGTLAVNPVLYRNIRYDPLRDFTPLHGLTTTPLLLVANPDRPFRDIPGLIAHARAHPGDVTFATSGVGTGTHLAAELFQAETGLRLTHVPYQGSAPALNDVVAGRVDIMFDYVVSTRAYLEANRLRAIATTGAARITALPEVPAIGEFGLQKAETSSWSCILGPANLPDAVVARFAEGFAAALAEPRVVQTLEGTGSTPFMAAPAALRAHIVAEVDRWRGIVERSGARAG